MLLLTDRARDHARTHTAFPCIVVALTDDLEPKTGYAAIACDIALDDPLSVVRLRRALAYYRTDTSLSVLFLMRDFSVFGYAQANALGATRIVPQSASVRAFVALIEASTLPGNVLPGKTVDGNAAGDTAVDRTAPEPSLALEALADVVAISLRNIFDAARKREPISVDTLNQGVEALLTAIKQTSIQGWIDVVRSYDDATYQHCLLVAGLVVAFSTRLGSSPKAQRLLLQAALMHDVGKARIPHAILNKAGPLSQAEMDLMRMHPVAGYYMIACQPGLDPEVLDIVLHHHEFLDGSGYPDHLRQDQISDHVRLVTICDIYAALIERRVYKPPMAPQEGYATLVAMGKKLDGGLVAAFRDVVDDVIPIGRQPSSVAA